MYGKIPEIVRNADASNAVQKISYTYDGQGNRTSKTVLKNTGNKTHTWYVRDAQGILLIGLRGASMPAADITKNVKRRSKGLYPSRVVNAQTIHQSVIANLLKQGHDLSVVQQFAGHKYPGSTQKYRQQEVKTLQATVNKCHPLG